MYYLLFGIFYLLSLLPFWVLYIISDGLYLLLYYVIGYRKDIILTNLMQAFPEKTALAHRAIAKRYMRSLADHMVETIKMMSISKRQISKRFDCDPSIFQYLEDNNRKSQIHLGHFFNWEWANLYIRTLVSHPFLVIYKPINDKVFNRLFGYMRKRFGTKLIASNNLLKEMQPYKKGDYTSVLVADQYPRGRSVYWFPFLNKMTPFFKGPEISAKRGDLSVVFGNIQKVKRGYYKIETKLAFEHAKDTENTAVTEAFVFFLEDCIKRQPENWLWSHRRWKREWKGETNK